MVKVLVYGYATGVFSSRKIASRLHEDVAFMAAASKTRTPSGITSLPMPSPGITGTASLGEPAQERARAGSGECRRGRLRRFSARRAAMNAPHKQPHNRVALVTGAGSGIGAACAQALLADGWRVAFAGRRADALQQAIDRAGDPFGDIAKRALAVPTDVTKPVAVAALFDAVVTRFGRLDLLFNNAGMGAPAVPIDELPLEKWQQVVETNLTGSFYCLQQAFRVMKQQSPRAGASSTTARSRPTRRGRCRSPTPPPSMQSAASRAPPRSTGVRTTSPSARSTSATRPPT